MSYADKFKLPELREGYEVNPSPPAPPPQHHCCEPETKPWEGFYYSAYGIAVKHGFSGTETEWLQMLKGKDGKDGISGKETYVHHQYSASDEWVINHDMDAYPSVTVADSAGNVVYGDVDYIDENSLTVSFVAPFSGVAYLN